MIGLGLWILRRIKLPCLPWVIACWLLNFPLLAQFNSWLTNYLFFSHLPVNGLSLSGLGLFSKRDAMRQYMAWDSLLSSVGSFAIVPLIMADATFLIHQLKPDASDRVPRIFGLVRAFSPAFGLLALILALVNHLLFWLTQHISP